MTKTEEAFTARFGGQVFYAMPDGRCVYEYRGRDYLLESAMVDPEAIMRDSLACGKLESRLAVTVKAPVRVPILQRCDCGATIHRIRSGKDMLCPACREPLKKTDVVAVVRWD